MRTIVVYALYVWVVVSLVALVVQQIRRSKNQRAQKRVPATDPTLSKLDISRDDVSLIETTTEGERARVPSARKGPTRIAASAAAAGAASTAQQSSSADTNLDTNPDTELDPEAIERATREKIAKELGTVPTNPESEAVPVREQPPNTVDSNTVDSNTVGPDTLKVPAIPDASDLAPAPVPLGVPSPTSDAPMAAAALSSEVASDPEKDLAELLAGIQLPCDLLPIIPDGIEPRDDHLTLVTSSHPTAVVGPAIADELERLGYELEPITESELLAKRGADSLTLEMVLSPTTAEIGGVRVYPSVTENDVVVAIRSGLSPSKRS